MDTKHDSENYPKEIIELSKIINEKIETGEAEDPDKTIIYEFSDCIIDEIRVRY